MTVSLENTLVWVHTWHGRDGKIQPCLDSIEASDIGKNYVVYRQPESESQRSRFTVESFCKAVCTGAKYVLRLEDDVIVCKTIMARLSQWKAPAFTSFGAGWLGYPRGVLRDRERIGFLRGEYYRAARHMHASLGVLLKSEDVAEICSLAIQQPEAERGDVDLILSGAVSDMGRRVFFHRPGLVTVNDEVESSLGHEHVPASEYSFVAD